MRVPAKIRNSNYNQSKLARIGLPQIDTNWTISKKDQRTLSKLTSDIKKIHTLPTSKQKKLVIKIHDILQPEHLE